MVAQARKVKIIAVGVIAFALLFVPVGTPGGFDVRPHPRVGTGQQRFTDDVFPRDAVVFNSGLAAQPQGAFFVNTASHVLAVAQVPLTRLAFDVIPVLGLAAVSGWSSSACRPNCRYGIRCTCSSLAPY